MPTFEEHRHGAAPAIVALLLVQLCLGYEWLVSGLTKIVHGDFPGGLGGELADLGKQSPGWYRGLLTNAIEPHAQLVGYGIEIAELLAGVVLIGSAVIWLARGARLSARARLTMQFAIGAATLVALVLLVNFELVHGGGFGMRLASDSFDEGIDLDTLLIGLHLAVLAFVVTALPARARSADAQSPSQPPRRAPRRSSAPAS
jgi:thiosulfate dehydrogenase (quinone) large subunit